VDDEILVRDHPQGRQKIVYFLEAMDLDRVKIGTTTLENVANRVCELATGSPVPLKLIGYQVRGVELESELHRTFEDERLGGEWFELSRPLRDYIRRSATPMDMRTSIPTLRGHRVRLGRKYSRARRRADDATVLDNGSIVIHIWLPREDAETLLGTHAAKGRRIEPEVSEIAAWALHLKIREFRRYLRKRHQTPGPRAVRHDPE